MSYDLMNKAEYAVTIFITAIINSALIVPATVLR